MFTKKFSVIAKITRHFRQTLKVMTQIEIPIFWKYSSWNVKILKQGYR